MARRRRKDIDDDDAPAPAGHNGVNTEKVAKFTADIEALLGDLATAKAEYMRQARTIRDEVNTVYGEAKDAGIPKRAFKAVIRARGLERKLDACRGDLEDADDIETFDQIRDALGDLAELPLGQAALGKASRPAA